MERPSARAIIKRVFALLAHDGLSVRAKNNRENKFLIRRSTEKLESSTAEITCRQPIRNENILDY